MYLDDIERDLEPVHEQVQVLTLRITRDHTDVIDMTHVHHRLLVCADVSTTPMWPVGRQARRHQRRIGVGRREHQAVLHQLLVLLF